MNYEAESLPKEYDDPRLKARYRRLQHRARSLMEAGELDMALSCQRQATALSPGSSDAWTNLGVLLKAADRTDEALASLQHACTLAPENPAPREVLAELYMNTARFDEAITHCKAILRCLPHNLAARNLLSTAYVQVGQIERAIDVTREMIVIAPFDFQSHYRRGVLCRQKNDWRNALDSFLTALKLSLDESDERLQAESAIESLDRHQLRQVLLLASEDRLFQIRLSRDTDEALKERGYYVSQQALSFLQQVASGQLSQVMVGKDGENYIMPARPHFYN